MNIEVNYLAVLLAGVASMVVGFLWYGPMLFAKPWMKLMGHTKESMEKEKTNMGKTYGISFVLALVTAYVLSHVMTLSQNFYNTGAVMTGLTSAFWMWLGFIMPVQATDVLFGSKKFKLFLINTGYQLASVLAMGVVLGLL
jgi:hypothetical protein